ncbi:MAG TPA: dienelactone hydrolase family protein [Myxococcota bacterium]|nr:dienelactone hydrolase family protein [Myxococcota bacterium]
MAARDRIPAYLVTPASGAGRGIVVIHDAWGLGDFVRDGCDRLAREGFVALAPDLLRGCEPRDLAAAEKLAAELDADAVVAGLESAIAELYNQPETVGPSIGALGFGLGGSLALLLAARQRRIGAVVDIGGPGLERELESELARVRAPVMAVLAGDSATPGAASAAERLRAGLASAGVRASVELRAGVGDGYMDDTRLDAYDAAAAAETWGALLAFFRSELA